MVKNLSAIKILLLALIASFGFAIAHASEPVVQKYNDVAYVSGGIGDEEQAAFKQMADDFNLNLVFAVEEGGNYLSDVAVRIHDSQGNMTLDAISDGPMFYAKLPAGQYKVEVSGFGESYEQNVEVSDLSQESLTFTWPRKKDMM